MCSGAIPMKDKKAKYFFFPGYQQRKTKEKSAGKEVTEEVAGIKVI